MLVRVRSSFLLPRGRKQPALSGNRHDRRHHRRKHTSGSDADRHDRRKHTSGSETPISLLARRCNNFGTVHIESARWSERRRRHRRSQIFRRWRRANRREGSGRRRARSRFGLGRKREVGDRCFVFQIHCGGSLVSPGGWARRKKEENRRRRTKRDGENDRCIECRATTNHASSVMLP
jgi:hypothetical protein